MILKKLIKKQNKIYIKKLKKNFCCRFSYLFLGAETYHTVSNEFSILLIFFLYTLVNQITN